MATRPNGLMRRFSASTHIGSRLFRKYALIFIGLVAAALLINSGFDFWFSYQENKAALVRVQQEKAESAAQRIAEFVEEIKSQIGWYVLKLDSPDDAVRVAKAIDEKFANSPSETKNETESAFAAGFAKQFGNIEFLILTIGRTSTTRC